MSEKRRLVSEQESQLEAVTIVAGIATDEQRPIVTAKKGRFFFGNKKRAVAIQQETLSVQHDKDTGLDAVEKCQVIEQCTHEIIIKDMCGSCGKDLRIKGGFSGERVEATVANVSMIHHIPELIVSSKIANEQGAKDHENIISQRKLILLVDLDQTLVHTSNRPPKPSEVGSPDMFGYRLFGGTFFTKVRPYTRPFLERMNKIYEMHIVTFGQRIYAHKIAELLDPGRAYFDNRVLSRDEMLSSLHKSVNLKALFPCGEQLIVMLDDRPDVWMHSEALIRVKPYRFFVEVGDINAPPQEIIVENPPETSSNGQTSKNQEEQKPAEESFSDLNNTIESETSVEQDSIYSQHMEDMADELEKELDSFLLPQQDAKPIRAVDELSQPVPPLPDDDNALEHIEKILVKVHSLFYQQYDRDKKVPDVKRIIGWLRSQVLAGECIVFSGVVPLGVDIRACEIHRLCNLFGAKVEDRVVEGQCTVLVAARAATEKIQKAERLGIPIVSIRWLDACFERWQKVDKVDFLFCNED